ncbi:hypothetical protein V8G54_012693 [Vigna mungo]|uniref:Uncharacterized protein n=1 Tax=Vigna mungo TaxID=3915 RepID=A0AAQ3NUR3_VIGMU
MAPTLSPPSSLLQTSATSFASEKCSFPSSPEISTSGSFSRLPSFNGFDVSKFFFTESISKTDLKPDSLALRYRGPVGCSPRRFRQKLQLQMPRHLGHVQLANWATSSAFSPYLVKRHLWQNLIGQFFPFFKFLQVAAKFSFFCRHFTVENQQNKCVIIQMYLKINKQTEQQRVIKKSTHSNMQNEKMDITKKKKLIKYLMTRFFSSPNLNCRTGHNILRVLSLNRR